GPLPGPLWFRLNFRQANYAVAATGAEVIPWLKESPGEHLPFSHHTDCRLLRNGAENKPVTVYVEHSNIKTNCRNYPPHFGVNDRVISIRAPCERCGDNDKQ